MRRHRQRDTDHDVMVLDRNFLPLHEVSTRHAIKAVASGRAQALNLASWVRTSVGMDLDWTSLKVIIFPHTNAVSDSRLTVGRTAKGVLRRDPVCQYEGCFNKATTVDHVIPRCQGGRNTWMNLVGCCLACNQKKGGRRPEEAGMFLKARVRAPRALLYERFEALVRAAA